jgi:hypothetical protein
MMHGTLEGLLDTDSLSGPGDPSFSSVVLLMPFDGVNGATSGPGMTDFSASNHGAATVSGQSITTAQSVFGGSSLACSFPNYLTYPDSTDWHLGSGQFTIECWVYPTGSGSTQYIVGQWGGAGGTQSWVLSVENSDNAGWRVSTTGSDTFLDLSSAGSTVPPNQWTAIAVDFDGTTYRLYCAGVCVATSTTLRNIFAGSGQNLTINGRADHGGNFFVGDVDELRITKGVARYATNGSYAVTPVAFPTH